jgi:hypothetical protein
MDAYHRLRDRARQLHDNPAIDCPYFVERIVLNGESLHHLRYSAEQESGKPEQMLKFRLFAACTRGRSGVRHGAGVSADLASNREARS